MQSIEPALQQVRGQHVELRRVHEAQLGRAHQRGRQRPLQGELMLQLEAQAEQRKRALHVLSHQLLSDRVLPVNLLHHLLAPPARLLAMPSLLCLLLQRVVVPAVGQGYLEVVCRVGLAQQEAVRQQQLVAGLGAVVVGHDQALGHALQGHKLEVVGALHASVPHHLPLWAVVNHVQHRHHGDHVVRAISHVAHSEGARPHHAACPPRRCLGQSPPVAIGAEDAWCSVQLLQALCPCCQLLQPCVVSGNRPSQSRATQQPDLLIPPPEWVVIGFW
mmetsp:Transcript_474/g.1262  ORF Transcript_474/g.1262 Transcript_474/m.1262 type:complete len:275 (-) Transcript_474:197-1021(-)